mgnify:CR=1 FL=1
MELDRTDRKILSELQRNGRVSNVELAQAVGLSERPCLRRVRALEESGVIDGYSARKVAAHCMDLFAEIAMRGILLSPVVIVI